MERDCDVIIVGGGLNGPALTIALARAGLGVVLIDGAPTGQRQASGFDGRFYALALASQRLLAGLGVWDRLAEDAQPMRRVRAGEVRPGGGLSSLALDFRAEEIGAEALGYLVADQAMAVALAEAVAAAGVRVVAGARVVAQVVEPGRVTVSLADGRQVTGAVLAGCDGRHSGTAARAGIRRIERDYGQHGVVATLSHERDHDATAWQVFAPSGPLALLPLQGRRSALVWSALAPEAELLMALPAPEFAAAVAVRFGDALGALSLESPRYSYPLSRSLAYAFVAPRLALVGDAAHGVHPVAGQGLNLGLRDVAALAEVLATALRRGEDIGAADVLERYQSWRRFDDTSMSLGIDLILGLFGSGDVWLSAARQVGIGAVQSVPALRRAFMRQAAGLIADAPALLQGRAL